ncbi:MAG: IclR family transcriptional regulator [Hyphomicrobiaceae bacterium]
MNTQVKSAVRVLDVLEFIASQNKPMFLRDITTALAIPKSSAHMLLSTLSTRGYVTGTATSGFRLASELAASPGWVGGHLRLASRQAQPIMDALANDLQETVALGVQKSDFDVRVVMYKNSPVDVRYDMTDTVVLPGYCSAMGYLLLAYSDPATVGDYLDSIALEAFTSKTVTCKKSIMRRLRQVAARGYSIHIDERLMGASGAAAPILAPNGNVVAALNISTVTPRFHAKRSIIIDHLVAAAARIEQKAFGSALSRQRSDLR